MLTFTELQTELTALKGTGRWTWIAKEAECDYGTISRIVRGKTAPGVRLAEKLSIAVQRATKMQRRSDSETAHAPAVTAEVA